MVRNPRELPFHDLADLQRLVREGKMKFATGRAQRQATELNFDRKTLEAFILTLKPAHFLKRHPQMNCFSGRVSLDADAYKMQFVCTTMPESSTTGDLIYTKLGIHSLPSGDSVAVISFHLDGSP